MSTPWVPSRIIAVTAAAPQQTTSLTLEAELRDRLRRLAEARRRTPHWLMREAIAQYVAREEAREHLRNGAMAAWADYRASGQHASGDDAIPPACRPLLA